MADMRLTNEQRFSVPAWGVSLALHGGAVWLAILFTAQVKPVLVEEIFKWDVAMVDTARTDQPTEPAAQPASERMPPAVRPVHPQVRPAPSHAEPPPDTVMHRVAPQQTARVVHPEVQPPKPPTPIEQREEPPPPVNAEPLTPPVTAVPEKTAESVEQQVAEVPKSRPEPVPAKEPEAVQSSEPVTAQHQPVAAPPSETADARPVQTPVPSAPAPLAPSSHAEPAPAAPPAAGPATQEAQVETPKTAAADFKANARWMAESLRRRVAELQRYPASARLNGQEGKVVLLAVIRSDGHLAEVTVQKSSGHQVLDTAAMDLVKLACPLHMKHAINTPEITVRVPVAYTLTN